MTALSLSFILRRFGRIRAGSLAAALLMASATAHAAAPVVQSIQADSVAIGGSVVVTARVTDADADLDYLNISVSGPGISGWLSLGDVNVSGNDASADLAWHPGYVGLYTVRVTAHDLSGAATLDKQFEVF